MERLIKEPLLVSLPAPVTCRSSALPHGCNSVLHILLTVPEEHLNSSHILCLHHLTFREVPLPLFLRLHGTCDQSQLSKQGTRGSLYLLRGEQTSVPAAEPGCLLAFPILTLRSSLVFLSRSIYSVNRLPKAERVRLKAAAGPELLWS